jgi:hypothetical protein
MRAEWGPRKNLEQRRLHGLGKAIGPGAFAGVFR